MQYSDKKFIKQFIFLQNQKIYFYKSPLLEKYNFKHGFFTKKSHDLGIELLSKKFKPKSQNFFIKQIHSDQIVISSETSHKKETFGDGMICNNFNQNLWIYTADCMPILIADKKNKFVAAIHCGRKGLEKKIIIKLIKLLKTLGCNKNSLLVAIGPTISSKKYVLNKDLFYKFNKKVNPSNTYLNDFEQKNYYQINSENKIELDLKKFAYFQLLAENIHSKNIDISNKCTYSLYNEFHSYRKTKTNKRQWSFISN